MLRLIRTTSDDPDFRALVQLLNHDLRVLNGDADAFYALLLFRSYTPEATSVGACSPHSLNGNAPARAKYNSATSGFRSVTPKEWSLYYGKFMPVGLRANCPLPRSAASGSSSWLFRRVAR